MNKRFITLPTFIVLTFLLILISGCDNDSSSEEQDGYNLSDYYHLSESGKWNYLVYCDTYLTYYDSYEMTGEEYTEGRNALGCVYTRLMSDSTLDFSTDNLYAFSGDSLFILQPYLMNDWQWELIPHVSTWKNKAIGDTIVWIPTIANSATYTYETVWTEEDAEIEVNGVTYTDCRVYESYGTNDFTGNYCDIIEYYAKGYGLVYMKNVDHIVASESRRVLTTETKLSGIQDTF